MHKERNEHWNSKSMSPGTKQVGMCQFTETRTWGLARQEERMNVSEKICHD